MKRSAFLKCVQKTSIFLVLMLVGFLPKSLANTPQNTGTQDPNASKQRYVQAYGKMPLSFERNIGQTNNEVKFMSRGSGYALFLTRNGETVLVLSTSSQKKTSEQPKKTPPAKFEPRREFTPPWVVRMKLVNADVSSQAEGFEELPGKANYFLGSDPKKWRTNVPLFSKVQYRNVYPGVDLVYYGNQQQLENDFIVAPGADPQSITLSFTGAEKLSLDSQGNLVLAAKSGEVRLEKPRIYQQVDGERREVSGGYVLKHAHEVGFQVAAYDATKPLVIDPTLSYSTYLGGSSFNIGYGIAVDSAGNAYITGETTSANFPTTIGAFQMIGPNAPCQYGQVCTTQTAFVTKLNPAGSALVYSTYLGGTFESGAFGIAVDGAGDAYLTGYSYSVDFPITVSAFQPVNKSAGFGYNAFVTELNPTGSALVYSTYLGGSKFDAGKDVAVDATGNAYVTGWAESTNFPTTPNAFQPVFRGLYVESENAFFAKLNPAALGPASLVYSTYLGGSNMDSASGIAVDGQNNAYVTGTTCSLDFPVTPLAYQTIYVGSGNDGSGFSNCDVFVSKLNPAIPGPASLVYSTFLGGGSDDGFGIAVDAQDNAYVTGVACGVFPVTLQAFQIANLGQCDGFVSKLNPSVPGPSALVYSTFLGGTRGDYALGIALDVAGNAYVTGETNSTDFPVTPDAFQPTKAGDFGQWDAFVTVLNPSGSALLYSTFLGGGGGSAGTFETNSSGRSIAVDASGNAYLTGYTYSWNFPTTPGAFQTTNPTSAGLTSAFVTKFSGFLTAP